jgi:hypothetical protein
MGNRRFPQSCQHPLQPDTSETATQQGNPNGTSEGTRSKEETNAAGKCSPDRGGLRPGAEPASVTWVIDEAADVSRAVSN